MEPWKARQSAKNESEAAEQIEKLVSGSGGRPKPFQFVVLSEKVTETPSEFSSIK